MISRMHACTDGTRRYGAADLSWLSVFPKLFEFAFPPFTILQWAGTTETISVTGHDGKQWEVDVLHTISYCARSPPRPENYAAAQGGGPHDDGNEEEDDDLAA